MTPRKFGMRITAGGEILDEEEVLDEEPEEAPAPARSQYDSRLMWWLTAMAVVWVLSCMGAAAQILLFDAPGMARLTFAEGMIIGVLTTRYHEKQLWPT